MNKFGIVRNCLLKEKEVLEKALASARQTRDSAPSAMESHSDTTRSQAEKLVFALEEKTKNIESLISLIPQDFKSTLTVVSLWSLIELKTNGEILKMILVPDGFGGREIDNIKLVSISTPLGNLIINKAVGDQITFNEKVYALSSLR
ncbi:hypothetical protein A2955_02945 [Candidatus Woesebacteria bacterium RIFCSPLOWO2_01_FULL_37_19]|uniref:Transcription elongation factor GreA/GreB C-terminal domain-containing protein n=2 Tax=Candidatus Woeseibacteriota TaxID=1752722 RepID=A0A1F8BBW4_9BACT|nr:MAG: hypothetical protein A2771_00100 [Candidatus Woesebacteria bacterium RIFCSPHIGHO2_01_FULL_38_26b]OGM61420.1 MAG: hypothetical protein A2955_02945 [Candidatus Woesebacteria bacterium RIFCSPLOWO2_01_FULL_37_19]